MSTKTKPRVQQNGFALVELLLALPILLLLLITALSLHKALTRRFYAILDNRNQAIQASHASTKTLADFTGHPALRNISATNSVE